MGDEPTETETIPKGVRIRSVLASYEVTQSDGCQVLLYDLRLIACLLCGTWHRRP